MSTKNVIEVSVNWEFESMGILFSDQINNKIEIATAPFLQNGMYGMWSPEHLLLASVAGSYMTTFLEAAQKQHLEFIDYDSKATCEIEIDDESNKIVRIDLHPVITLPHINQKNDIETVLELVKKSCILLNSIKPEVHINPEIRFINKEI